MKISTWRGGRVAVCIVDGDPSMEQPPDSSVFIGMEQEPNGEPRYGQLYHPCFNLPCYVTPKKRD